MTCGISSGIDKPCIRVVAVRQQPADGLQAGRVISLKMLVLGPLLGVAKVWAEGADDRTLCAQKA